MIPQMMMPGAAGGSGNGVYNNAYESNLATNNTTYFFGQNTYAITNEFVYAVVAGHNNSSGNRSADSASLRSVVDKVDAEEAAMTRVINSAPQLLPSSSPIAIFRTSTKVTIASRSMYIQGVFSGSMSAAVVMSFTSPHGVLDSTLTAATSLSLSGTVNKIRGRGLILMAGIGTGTGQTFNPVLDTRKHEYDELLGDQSPIRFRARVGPSLASGTIAVALTSSATANATNLVACVLGD